MVDTPAPASCTTEADAGAGSGAVAKVRDGHLASSSQQSSLSSGDPTETEAVPEVVVVVGGGSEGGGGREAEGEGLELRALGRALSTKMMAMPRDGHGSCKAVLQGCLDVLRDLVEIEGPDGRLLEGTELGQV